MASKLIRRGKKGIYYFSYRQNGKQILVCTHTNDRYAAEKQRADITRDLLTYKVGTVKHGATWQAFVNEYLAYSAGNKRPRSTKRDKTTLSTFARLCPIDLFSEFTYSILEQYKAKRKSENIKESSINRELNTLKNCGKVAVDLKYCDKDPVKKVKRYPVDSTGNDRFFTPEEAKRLLKGIEAPHLKTICLFGLLGATRIGEALNMTWQDIDFINNTVYFTAKGDWKPKTRQKQTIPLNEDLKKYLLKLKRYSEYICAYPNGSLMGDNTAVALISRRMRELGLKNATSHTLRHTCLSWAAQTMSWLSVVLLARHTNPKMTMRYAHLSPEFQNHAINKLPHLITF